MQRKEIDHKVAKNTKEDEAVDLEGDSIDKKKKSRRSTATRKEEQSRRDIATRKRQQDRGSITTCAIDLTSSPDESASSLADEDMGGGYWEDSDFSSGPKKKETSSKKKKVAIIHSVDSPAMESNYDSKDELTKNRTIDLQSSHSDPVSYSEDEDSFVSTRS